MRKRVKNAVEQYDKTFKGSPRGRFYSSDFDDVRKEAGSDTWNLISIALKAGFIIGYRCRINEERNQTK